MIDCQCFTQFFRPPETGRKNGQTAVLSCTHEIPQEHGGQRVVEIPGRGTPMRLPEGLFPASRRGWPEKRSLTINDLQNFSGLPGKFRPLPGKFRRSFKVTGKRRRPPTDLGPLPQTPTLHTNEGMLSGPTLGLGRKAALWSMFQSNNNNETRR